MTRLNNIGMDLYPDEREIARYWPSIEKRRELQTDGRFSPLMDVFVRVVQDIPDRIAENNLDDYRWSYTKVRAKEGLSIPASALTAIAISSIGLPFTGIVAAVCVLVFARKRYHHHPDSLRFHLVKEMCEKGVEKKVAIQSILDTWENVFPTPILV